MSLTSASSWTHPGRILVLSMLAFAMPCTAQEAPAQAVPPVAVPAVAMINPSPRSYAADTSPKQLPAVPVQTGAAGNEPADPKNPAMAAALADGITTGLALSSGAAETNPLIFTSPVGLIALTGMKLGLVKFSDTLPKEDKRLALKSTSSIWGGAAVNNVMVLLAAPPPLPIIAGLVMGIATWTHMQEQYDNEDRQLAEREAAAKVAVDAAPVAAVAQADSQAKE